MKRLLILTAVFAMFAVADGKACTNFIVTKGASTDGSIMVSYAADCHNLYGELYKHIGGKHKAGTMIPVIEWVEGRNLGMIPQVAETYSTVGNMNEYQLLIGETTFGGRKELQDSTGRMDYGSVIYLTLQRAKTAREAIKCIVDLINEHGYASSGESFSIADANEVWIMEFVGKGIELDANGKNKNKGIVWVARRIPDGYISGHANQSRITTFPLNDPENCLYSDDVISFAREKGYFNGADAEFSFADAYCPLDFSAMRGCDARVWSFFKDFNPDMQQYLDYVMGHNPKNRLPLWVKPAKKVSPKDMFDAMRDHYEGTPMDMTKDLGAGGEECPYRWRPMTFEVDGKEYTNERATATQQTAFWFVGQTRSWLPAQVGGVLWFGVDDAATSSLTPIYSSVTDTPECFRVGNGNMKEYSETSAFWIYNRVTQFAYLRYNQVGKEVRQNVDEWENAKLAEIANVDKKAVELYKDGKGLAKTKKYLTEYSVNTAQEMFDKWVKLDKYLMVKYIDGNVKKQDADGNFIDNGNDPNTPAMPSFPGYTEKWKRAVAADNGKVLQVVPVKE